MSTAVPMSVSLINPFVKSVFDVFENMLNCPVERGNPNLVKRLEVTREILAMVGMSGPICGTVAILLPCETALGIAGRFLGESFTHIDETVMDAMSELVNMIGGGAKAQLAESNGYGAIDLSLPSVIEGKGYSVYYPKYTTWLEIPFTSEVGNFSLRVSFKQKNA